MEERLITYLEDCLAALAAGESIESCLARYPDQAEELAALLQVALALDNLPQPGPSAATSSVARAQFLAEVEHRRGSAKGGLLGLGASIAAVRSRILRRLPQANWMLPVRGLATAALTLALVFLIGGGVIYAASGSLPGDPLYGFKLLGEDVRRAVALNDDNRIQLEEAFTAQRQDEVKRLLVIGRPEEVIFGGYLLQQTDKEWLVDDIPVVVSESTRMQTASLSHGFVEIHGLTQADGTVQALLIEKEGDEIIGRIEAMNPGAWQIAGLRIQVDGKTFLEGQLDIEDCVEVHARRFPNGTLLALEIERTKECKDRTESGEDRTTTATPSATPTLTATATPAPSPTWTSTAMPTATREPTPTATPAPDDEDDEDKDNVTSTPEPSPTPTDEPDDDDDGDGDDNGDGKDDKDKDDEDQDTGDGEDEGGEDEDDSGGSDDDGNPESDDDSDDTGSEDNKENDDDEKDGEKDDSGD